MPVFEGDMKLESDPGSSMASVLTVDDNRLSLTVSGQPLGEWELDVLAFSRQNGAMRIEVDDEAVFFSTAHMDRLEEAVGLSEPDAAETTKRTRRSRGRHGSKPERRRPKLSDVPLKFRLGGLAVLVLFGMALVVPSLLVMLLGIVGSVGLLLALTALMEPTVAARLPAGVTPQRLVYVGLGLMLAALAVAAVT